MSLHRYDIRALYGDYIRAGLGMVATIAPIAFVRPDWPIAMMLGSIGLLCFYFVAQTYIRHRTVVGIDDEGIFMRGLHTVSFRWTELSRFNLKYYSLRRDRLNGWMELTVKSGTREITFDSRLEDFVTIVRRAHVAAKANQLTMNAITQANLLALRIY